MAITTTPPSSPQVAYLPAVFGSSVVSVNNIQWAVVSVYVNASLVAQLNIPLLSESPAGTYNFTFDVQRIIQDFVAPYATSKTPVIGGYDAATVGVVAEVHCQYYVEIDYLYRDATTNTLIDLGATDTSSTYYSIAATRQRDDAQDLSDRIPNTTTPENYLWLTNAPQAQTVCSTDNAFLSHIATTDTRRLRIRTRNNGGGLLQELYTDIDSSVTFEVQTLGVGIPNLSALAWEDAGGTPAVLSFTGVDYYELTPTTNLAPYLPSLQQRRFDIGTCCNGLRLHWFNALGGGDSYTFPAKIETSISVKDLKAKKTLSTTFDYNDKGDFKLFTDSVKAYKLQTSNIDETTALWLAEAVKSVETYIETDTGFLPCVVNAESLTIQKLKVGELNLVVLSLDVIEANTEIIQHY